jgi:cytochrome c-type biogenesis protein CcmH/NrfF
MILVAARYAAPATYTPRDKQTRFFERTKEKQKQKQKQNKTIPDSNLNLAKSMTHHSQTKN